MVTDGTLILDYGSLIFVDPGVQIGETWFSYHGCSLQHARSLVVHVSN